MERNERTEEEKKQDWYSAYRLNCEENRIAPLPFEAWVVQVEAARKRMQSVRSMLGYSNHERGEK